VRGFSGTGYSYPGSSEGHKETPRFISSLFSGSSLSSFVIQSGNTVVVDVVVVVVVVDVVVVVVVVDVVVVVVDVEVVVVTGVVG